MAISEKQFIYLQEMGISLWQQKGHETAEVNSEANTENYDKHVAINLADLQSQQFFIDTLLALGKKVADFHQVSPNKLQSEDFIWQFNSELQVDMSNNTLTTPTIDQLQNTPALKKRLYQQLCC